MFSLTENHNLEVFHCPSKQEVTKLSHLEKIIEKRGHAPTHFNPVALTNCCNFSPILALVSVKGLNSQQFLEYVRDFQDSFFSFIRGNTSAAYRQKTY